ncbi:FixH family protein [Pseudomonadota bacterium]
MTILNSGWPVLKIISVIFLSLLFMGEVFAGSPQHQDHQSGHESHSEQGDSHHGKMSFADRENAVTQPSRDGLYKLSLFSNQSPIPLQIIHSWTLHVETADGKPADNLKIYVNGGMPMHRHGFPTRPKVSDHLGGGDYRVNGIKFNMAGHWEMRFNITEKGKPAGRGNEDRVVFKIHLE